MRDEVIQKQLSDAIVRGDVETAETKAKVIAQYAKDPTEALDDLYDAYRTAESLHSLGGVDEERFVASTRAVQASLNILKSSLIPKQTRFTARVCIGPISGGTDLMSAFLTAMFAAAGHEAVDLSRSSTPKELLRNAEQSGAELLVVVFDPRTVGLLQEFLTQFESGGFQNKFQVIAFAREIESSAIQSNHFVLTANDPVGLLSKTTELLIRSQSSARKQCFD